jgi:hypothetical protein
MKYLIALITVLGFATASHACDVNCGVAFAPALVQAPVYAPQVAYAPAVAFAPAYVPQVQFAPVVQFQAHGCVQQNIRLRAPRQRQVIRSRQVIRN